MKLLQPVLLRESCICIDISRCAGQKHKVYTGVALVLPNPLGNVPEGGYTSSRQGVNTHYIINI